MFEFLEEMAEHFELGIFTCSMPEYADIIINHMKHIDFRLYRHHTVKIKGEYIKDLSRIGRDLRSLILVDNLEQNYRLQKENGITIRSWYGDRSDDFLRRLANELAKLAKMGVEDVRIAAFERKFL
jgi:RNA polymerase II subunit A small phosphatase-like protein